MDCWYRNVPIFPCGDLKCLAFGKGLDYQDGKFIYFDPFILDIGWALSLDFELVRQEWSV